MRILFEYSKLSRNQRSDEYINKFDSFDIQFADYFQIFNHFLNDLPPNPSTGKTCENRMILGEWMKFSLQLNYKDETIRNELINLMFSFVGQTFHTYEDYKYLLKGRRFHLGHFGGDDDGRAVVDGDGDEQMDHGEGEVGDSVNGFEQSLDGDEAYLELEIRPFNNLGVSKDI